ncbi:unnamed protein product, partial [Onchocerca ochengi]|uniref:DNA topoisomerase (ATP-hydrolyzing) n=1 Tax=Onchocerca ochengi TaxID=42157 RepID=A0A182EZI8_ONCOC
MVGIVKRTLERAVKKNLLERGEFTTLIMEIEFLVNERPLVDYERNGDHICRKPISGKVVLLKGEGHKKFLENGSSGKTDRW